MPRVIWTHEMCNVDSHTVTHRARERERARLEFDILGFLLILLMKKANIYIRLLHSLNCRGIRKICRNEMKAISDQIYQRQAHFPLGHSTKMFYLNFRKNSKNVCENFLLFELTPKFKFNSRSCDVRHPHRRIVWIVKANDGGNLERYSNSRRWKADFHVLRTPKLFQISNHHDFSMSLEMLMRIRPDANGVVSSGRERWGFTIMEFYNSFYCSVEWAHFTHHRNASFEHLLGIKGSWKWR